MKKIFLTFIFICLINIGFSQELLTKEVNTILIKQNFNVSSLPIQNNNSVNDKANFIGTKVNEPNSAQISTSNITLLENTHIGESVREPLPEEINTKIDSNMINVNIGKQVKLKNE